MACRTIIFAALCLAFPCQAQTVFKVVGADGTIAYTDRPPPASAGQVVAPLGKPSPPRATPATPVQANGPVIEAALQVYVKQVIVHSANELCRTFAALNPKLGGAAEAAKASALATRDWRNRHAVLADQKNVVLHDLFSRGELIKFADDAQAQNNMLISQLWKASKDEHLAWCQQVPNTLSSVEFDLVRNPHLVNLIARYVPRKQQGRKDPQQP